MQSTQTCVFTTGCNDAPFSRALCQPHYMLARNTGQLDSYPKTRNPPQPKKPRETEAERTARRLKAGARAGVNAPHGSRSRYQKGGCRCDLCKFVEAKRGRDRYARRIASGGRGDAGRIQNICRTCGKHFATKRKRTYCGNDCYLLAIGNAPLRSWWISTGSRLMIYHRDGWRCQLCGDPVDMCAEPSAPIAPALDHIVPRSRGGNDDPDNLRLTHSLCNIKRGSAVDEYVTSAVAVEDHGFSTRDEQTARKSSDWLGARTEPGGRFLPP